MREYGGNVALIVGSKCREWKRQVSIRIDSDQLLDQLLHVEPTNLELGVLQSAVFSRAVHRLCGMQDDALRFGSKCREWREWK
jgi:hypothetical protein